MNYVAIEIEELKARLAILEKAQRVGYTACEGDSWGKYEAEADHTVLRDLEGVLLAVIVDEQSVRSYLANKDAQNA